MPANKDKEIVPIKYTSRDFQTIKGDLVTYAKTYYPDTFKDFSSPSFGSLMLDTVAYVGDVLSFYVDYQANESFLSTANEFSNVIKLGRQMGYKFQWAPSASGLLTFYILVPAKDGEVGPDPAYVPVLKRGSKFTSDSGNIYTLVEDVDFSNSVEIVVGEVSTSDPGLPTSYAYKAYGKVISGKYFQENVTVGAYERFRKVPLTNSNISEVVSVFDSNGNQWFEVEHLSQDSIHIPVQNTGADKNLAPRILKTISVPRRFTVERFGNATFLQFGYGSEDQLSKRFITNPNDVIMKQHARDYISDTSFDPTVLNQSDKFGVTPVNTTLTIKYRSNLTSEVNAAVAAVNRPVQGMFDFLDADATDASKIATVRSSLECTNDEPIVGDVSIPSPTEIKHRITSQFASQQRAVTKNDYVGLVYRMPQQFGAIKRCNVLQDVDSFKRNLNLYVVSEDTDGLLTETNSTIKQNLRTWINQHKMINDTVDILDATIVNIGINFVAIGKVGHNKYELLNSCYSAIADALTFTRDIGEPMHVSDVYQILNAVPGVVDTVDVKFVNLAGGVYSDASYSIKDNMSADGRYLASAESVILEVKYPRDDIVGTIR